MANKEQFDKDRKKKSARDFRELDELREVKSYNNKEISVIHPVDEKKGQTKNEERDI